MTVIIEIGKKEMNGYIKRIKECNTEEDLRKVIISIHTDGCIDGCLVPCEHDNTKP